MQIIFSFVIIQRSANRNLYKMLECKIQQKIAQNLKKKNKYICVYIFRIWLKTNRKISVKANPNWQQWPTPIGRGVMLAPIVEHIDNNIHIYVYT